MALPYSLDKEGEALRDERGFTVTELLVSMAIFLVALTVYFAVEGFVTKGVNTERLRSVTQDQERLAFERLDRDTRSATAVSVSSDGTSMVLSEQAGDCLPYSFQDGTLMRDGAAVTHVSSVTFSSPSFNEVQAVIDGTTQTWALRNASVVALTQTCGP